MDVLRIVRMEFHPESCGRFDRLFESVQARILASPGCISVIAVRPLDEPHVRVTMSRWNSASALEAYRNSALFGEVWPETKSMFSAKPVAWSMEWNPEFADFLQFGL